MPSLSRVLEQASEKSAYEITLESGQPPVITTNRGPEPLGDVLGESELFEALSEVLGPEEQAELAVGNVVQFDVSVGSAQWNLVTEPGPEGILVRGRTPGAPAGSGASPGLSLPGLDPYEPEEEEDAPRGSSARWQALEAEEVGIPLDDDDVHVEIEPDEEEAAVEVAHGGEVSFADLNADLGVELGDDAGVDVGVDSEADFAASLGAELEVELQDTDFTGVSGSPPAAADADPAPASASASVEPGAPEKVPLMFTPPPSTADARRATSPMSPPMPPMPPTKPAAVRTTPEPVARQSTPLPAASPGQAGELASHVALLEPGTLVFLRAEGAGEDLAGALQTPFAVVDDQGGARALRTASEQLAEGDLVIVRCEDPSRHLPWILRRLEEGIRVAIETRARDAEGARRVLLGVDASARAEAWLDQHPQRWFARDGERWVAH